MRIFILLLVSGTILEAAYIRPLHSACKVNKGQLENGRTELIMREGLYNEGRQYSCNVGYVMNLKAPTVNIMFQCEKRNDVWFWRNTLYTALNLTDVKCEQRAECPDPPTIENMEYKVLQRYRIKHSNTLSIQGYFTGDMYEYTCKTGFNQVSSKRNAVAATTESYFDDYYGLWIMDDNDATKKGPVTCSSDGTWNHTVTETCVAVMCDATRFVNISNGNITNYKDTYNYMEYLILSCDPMYQPIDGIDVVYCKIDSSFGQLTDFGCEAKRCPLPERPIHGYVYYTYTVIGSNITFMCEHGYTLRGRQQWTCQDNGQWDAYCVLCEDKRKDDYCLPPCVPMGATWTTDDSQFRLGSVIQFECKQQDGIFTDKINRTCLRNKLWSGHDIDCIGKNGLTNVVMNLKAALSTIPLTDAEKKNMTAYLGRSIDVGRIGVDAYILVDISRSISVAKYNDMMNFTKQLLPYLQIGIGETETKLVLYFFASQVLEIFDCQMEHKMDEYICSNYSQVQRYIDKLDRNDITYITGTDTALAAALEKIKTHIEIKKMLCNLGYCSKRSDIQKVVILLSDGQHNSGGDPTEIAEDLKSSQYNAEIFSIAVGRDDKGGFKTMKSIASEKENERHFFAIQPRYGDLKRVISEMIIEQNKTTDCGTTDPILTNIANAINENLVVFAKNNAWPWMVGLYDKYQLCCGGSLIDKQWILTAAHCVTDSRIVKVHIGQTSTYRSDFLEYTVDKIIAHEDFNIARSFLYDIALIKLREPVTYEGYYIHNVAVLPVCLFDKDEITVQHYEALDYTYGVMTGWGRMQSGERPEILKQMQMQVISHDECKKDLTLDDKDKLNDTLMFCAGGKDSDGNIIDACKGDSGNPFVVMHPYKEDTFIQTGISSFGFGDKCYQEGKYSVYTKLTVDLVMWIKTTKDDN